MRTKPDYDRLYEIAEAQSGYFTARQARGAGYSWERLSSITKAGRFIRVKPGIYRLVHFPSSPYKDLFIAWLRAGSAAVISHESALTVYEITDVLPGKIHVIIPQTASRRRLGICLHTNRLRPDEINHRYNLPVTTVDRTIADVILSGLATEQVRMGIQESLQRGLTTPEQLLAQAKRRGKKVEKVIRSVLEEDTER